MTIKLKQVIDAVANANEVYAALYNIQTGKMVYLPDEIITGERNENQENTLENLLWVGSFVFLQNMICQSRVENKK